MPTVVQHQVLALQPVRRPAPPPPGLLPAHAPASATATASSDQNGTDLLSQHPAPLQSPTPGMNMANGRPAPPPQPLPNRHHRGGDVVDSLSSEGGSRARIPPPSSNQNTLSTPQPQMPNQSLPNHPQQYITALNNGSHPSPHANMNTHTSPPLQPPPPRQQQQQQPTQVPGPVRRQGKPIFEWFKGKLGARRSSDADHTRDAAAVVTKRTIYNRAPATPRGDPRTWERNGREVLSTPRGARGGNEPDSCARLTLSPAEIFGPALPLTDDHLARTESVSLRSYSISISQISERRRELNNPYPSLPIPHVRRSYPTSTIDSGSRPPSMSMLSRSRTPSLTSLSSRAHPRISVADDDSVAESFPLAGRVADEDASVRPIAPSPERSISIISRTGSAPLGRSDSVPRRVPLPTASHPERRDTFSSLGGVTSAYSDDGANSRQESISIASTKPTTVMSFESGPPAVAHIAVAPPSTTSSPVTVASAVAGSSIQGVPSPISPTFLPPAIVHEDTAADEAPPPPEDDIRVPRHTRYHPRNNPHPSSPPGPDASTVTLASSTFALVSPAAPRPSSIRHTTSPSAYHAPHLSTSPSVAFADPQQGGAPAPPGSLYDGLSTHALSLHRTRAYGRADDDASMRALRRRGSWESSESRWSWRPGAGPGPGGVGADTASMFSALNRRSEYLENDDGAGRSSVYTRDSFRTAMTGWVAETTAEGGDGLAGLGSETGLHRPLSVKAV